MLVLVEMHTVHRAGSGDPPRIEEIATTLAHDFFVSISEPNALRLCPLELRGNRALRLLDGRRRHHDDLRGRHPWLDGRSADRIHECRDPLRRMPRVVRMHGLKVVLHQPPAEPVGCMHGLAGGMYASGGSLARCPPDRPSSSPQSLHERLKT